MLAKKESLDSFFLAPKYLYILLGDTMINFIKSLFGVKPSEVKVEVASAPEVTPEPVVPVAVVEEVQAVNPEPVVVEEPVVEVLPEELAPAKVAKVKKSTVKKPRAKKTTK
jgi:hypothetical protein